MRSSLIIIITAIVTTICLLLFQQPEGNRPLPNGSSSGVIYEDSANVAGVDSVGAQSIAPQPVPQQVSQPKPPAKLDRTKYHNRYDIYFKKYSDRLFGPAFDWRWFKAQGIAESNLDSTARSYCHARGVMQILPSTHADIVRQNPWIEDNIWSPRWNIAAGITYDRQMWNYWEGKIRPEEERIKFMFGSYNGGYGNVLKSYVIVMKYKMPPTWHFVTLAGKRDVPSWRVVETENYVKRIFKVKSELR